MSLPGPLGSIGGSVTIPTNCLLCIQTGTNRGDPKLGVHFDGYLGITDTSRSIIFDRKYNGTGLAMVSLMGMEGVLPGSTPFPDAVSMHGGDDSKCIGVAVQDNDVYLLGEVRFRV